MAHLTQLGSCRTQSVYPTTLLSGRLSSLNAYPVLCAFFRQKLTTALLEKQKEENDRRKYFMIMSPRKNIADSKRLENATFWSPVGHASQWIPDARTRKNGNRGTASDGDTSFIRTLLFRTMHCPAKQISNYTIHELSLKVNIINFGSYRQFIIAANYIDICFYMIGRLLNGYN